MRKVNLALIVLASISLFSIIYLNSISAQDFEVLSLDSEIQAQIDEKGYTNVIVYLRDNFRESDFSNIDKIRKVSNKNIQEIRNSMDSGNFEVIHEYDAFNGFAARVDQDSLVALQKNPMVKEIHAERMLYVQMQQSMPLINATQAWNVPLTATTNLTGVGQAVCVIDSGIDYMHPALGGAWGVKVIGGFDFVNNDTDPRDDNGHGTHVAGIIAAKGMNGASQIRGVAPDALLIAEKVCDSSGWCTNANVLAGVNHCFNVMHARKVSAISISLGDLQSHTNATCPTWMNTAVNISKSYGVPIVASSGNQGFKTGISHPACIPDVISVGATYDANHSALGGMLWTIPGGTCTDGINAITDKVACASNSGTNLDVLAPGAKIHSTRSSIGGVGSSCGGGFPILTSECSGTSQAAAHVSGSIALIKQKYRTGLQGPSGVRRIEYMLKKSNVMVTDPGNSLVHPRLTLMHLL